MSEELLIDDSNFNKYFRDCRTNRPERGDVMAKYTAVAEFVAGHMKKDLIDLLQNKEKALAATQVMRKLGCATEKDSIRVCREICEDLDNGMTEAEVEAKPYKYTMEMFFYTKKEYLPEDPHWSLINIANLDSFLDKQNRRVTIETKVVVPEVIEEEVAAVE
jgi:hypothetical protein